MMGSTPAPPPTAPQELSCTALQLPLQEINIQESATVAEVTESEQVLQPTAREEDGTGFTTCMPACIDPMEDFSQRAAQDYSVIFEFWKKSK